MSKWFKSLVLGRLLYGAAIYYPYLSNTRRRRPETALHIPYLRTILGAHRKTPHLLLYRELCTYPLEYFFLRRVIRYWNKLVLLPTTDLRHERFSSQFRSAYRSSWTARVVALLTPHVSECLHGYHLPEIDLDSFPSRYHATSLSRLQSSSLRLIQFYSSFTSAVTFDVPVYFSLTESTNRLLLSRFRLGFHFMSHAHPTPPCPLCSMQPSPAHLVHYPALSSLRISIYGFDPPAVEWAFEAPQNLLLCQYLKSAFRAWYSMRPEANPILN